MQAFYELLSCLLDAVGELFTILIPEWAAWAIPSMTIICSTEILPIANRAIEPKVSKRGINFHGSFINFNLSAVAVLEAWAAEGAESAPRAAAPAFALVNSAAASLFLSVLLPLCFSYIVNCYDFTTDGAELGAGAGGLTAA